MSSIQHRQNSTINTHYSVPMDGILPGGRLKHFLKNWTKITNHPWPLSVVENGYRLQFLKNPIPWKTNPLKSSLVEQSAIDTAVEKFLQAGIIQRSPTQNRQFLSTFFTIQEETKQRPILNCTKLNQFLQVQHFKMEGVPALRDILEKDDFLCKIDLKDAYVVVTIHPESQKYLTFEHGGIVYQYTSLVFGLSVAPRIFSKLMRYAVESLRERGIRLIYYLDDICIMEKSKEKMEQTVNLICQHLEDLGFLFNTRTMTISLPTGKLNKLLQRLRQAEKSTVRSCRWIASLLGKMTAVIPAIGEALLHIRHLQRDLAKSLQQNHHNWDMACKISQWARSEIQWWKTFLVKKNGLPIQQVQLSSPTTTIYVDASDMGWGVSSSMMKTSGFWNQEDKAKSINVRELTAIYYAILMHAKV